MRLDFQENIEEKLKSILNFAPLFGGTAVYSAGFSHTFLIGGVYFSHSVVGDDMLDKIWFLPRALP